MTRCEAFYSKWANDPNWCNKCQRSVEKINNYMELLSVLEQRGIPKKQIIHCLSEYSVQVIFERKNASLKERIIDIIAEKLKTEPMQRLMVRHLKLLLRQMKGESPKGKELVEAVPKDCCPHCGETEPSFLDEHHLLPVEIGGKDGPTLIVCKKEHRLLTDLLRPYVEEVRILLNKGEVI